MEMDEETLSRKYSLVKLNVIGSTQISKFTGAIISRLGAAKSSEKPVITILTAKARYANKLISIVEIAKRELATTNIKCFQYNALRSEMTDIARSSEEAGEDENDKSDDAFETIGAPNLGGTKKRAVPIMTTYLCSTSVRELKTAYG